MSSNHFTYKGYTGSAELSAEDQCFHGKILFIDDIITYEGESCAELKAAFEGAVDRYITYCDESGKPANKPYSGSFNVRTGPELHRKVAKEAHLRGMKLNQLVIYALETLIEQNGVRKVEHHHEHVVMINADVGTAAPSFKTLTAIGVQSAEVH